MRAKHLILPFIAMVLASGSLSAQYCQPAYSNGCGYGDGLILFKLGTITQVLECPWNKAYYQDCSSLTAEMEAGRPYTLSVMSGFPGVNVTIWADMNDDMNFDSTEILIRNFECSFDSSLYTSVIILPEDSKEGYHRLRYRTSWMMHVPEPCDTLGYGNSADFTIHTLPAHRYHSDAANEYFSVYPNPAINSATIEQREGGAAKIELIDLSGKTVISIQSENLSMPVDLSNVAPGMYFMKYEKGSSTAYTCFSVTR